MSLPRLHLIAPFYSRLTKEWEHDGFTTRTMTFSRMMQARDFEVIEYAAGGSESEASQKVAVIPEGDSRRFFQSQSEKETRPKADLNSQGHTAYSYRLIGELCSRVQTGDIICHVYGNAEAEAVLRLPNNSHVEIGVGYGTGPFGAWRIFDSQAWRHFHWGKDEERRAKDEKGSNKNYSWVIPNPHDPKNWPLGPGSKDTVVYFGRMDQDKGMSVIVEIIREHAMMVNEGLRKPLKFVFAGHGNFDQAIYRPVHRAPNPLHKSNGVEVTYLGTPSNEEAATLLGGALCLLAPTQYIEPLHNCSIQAMLCGTPVLASDFGCFTETVRNYRDGYRCSTLGDWLAGLDAVADLDRETIQFSSEHRFGIDRIGADYEKVFRQIGDLIGPGWNSRHSHRFEAIPPLDPAPSMEQPIPPLADRQLASLDELPAPSDQVTP